MSRGSPPKPGFRGTPRRTSHNTRCHRIPRQSDQILSLGHSIIPPCLHVTSPQSIDPPAAVIQSTSCTDRQSSRSSPVNPHQALLSITRTPDGFHTTRDCPIERNPQPKDDATSSTRRERGAPILRAATVPDPRGGNTRLDI